ncbi:unnamed protein product, partial [Staurois parvus]
GRADIGNAGSGGRGGYRECGVRGEGPGSGAGDIGNVGSGEKGYSDMGSGERGYRECGVRGEGI